jgi:uncharacterized protein (TIGR02246 family)
MSSPISNDEQQIRDLVATWMAATREGDVATVLSLMTDDVVFLVAGREPFGKDVFEAQLATDDKGRGPRIEGRSDIQEIHVAGDVAYMWTRLRVEMTPAGSTQTTRRAGHTLTILRKTQGRWQIARDANLLVPVDN